MKLTNYHNALKDSNEEDREFVMYSMDILDRIHELLNKKFDGKQKKLADYLGKSEAEISRMVSGVQNFTLKTLIKLQCAFEDKIISVHTDCVHADFVQVRLPYNKPRTDYAVTDTGDIYEEKVYQKANVSKSIKQHNKDEVPA